MLCVKKIYEIGGQEPRLGGMEGLRAYAAFIVYLVHLLGMFYSRRLAISFDEVSVDTLPLVHKVSYWVWSSHYGVDLFFLLSGFLIFKMVSKPGFYYPRFLLSRLARIYPVFIVTLAGYVFCDYKKTGVVQIGKIVANMLFFNGIAGLDISAYNSPSWSLFYEFSFYLLFPAIVLWSPRKPGIRALGCLSAGVFIGVLVLSLKVSSVYFRFMMFLVGALLAVIDREKTTLWLNKIPDTIVFILYIASCAYFIFDKNFVHFIPIYAIPSFLLVAKTIYGSGWINRLFSMRYLRYFGNISYSYYLVHLLVLLRTFKWIPTNTFSSPLLNLAVIFVVSFVMATLVSTLLFVALEKPYFYWKHK